MRIEQQKQQIWKQERIRAGSHPRLLASGGQVSPITSNLPKRQNRMPKDVTACQEGECGNSLRHVSVRFGTGRYDFATGGTRRDVSVRSRTRRDVLVRRGRLLTAPACYPCLLTAPACYPQGGRGRQAQGGRWAGEKIVVCPGASLDNGPCSFAVYSDDLETQNLQEKERPTHVAI